MTALREATALFTLEADEPLRLLEIVAPPPGEVTRATDANEDPVFTLVLSRALTPDERRVVSLELPTARLHEEDAATMGLALVPSQMVIRPQGVLILVAGISSVAIALRAAELEMSAKSRMAADAVNYLLNG